jgi:hypothetical protein
LQLACDVSTRPDLDTLCLDFDIAIDRTRDNDPAAADVQRLADVAANLNFAAGQPRTAGNARGLPDIYMSARSDQVVTDIGEYPHIAASEPGVIANHASKPDFSTRSSDIRLHVAFKIELSTRRDNIAVHGRVHIDLAARDVQVIIDLAGSTHVLACDHRLNLDGNTQQQKHGYCAYQIGLHDPHLLRCCRQGCRR